MNSNMASRDPREWDPESILFKKEGVRNVLVIPNQLIRDDVMPFVISVWSRAIYKMCIDGGADSLRSAAGKRADDFVPDYVTGDFDSVSKDTLDFYGAKGSKVVCTPDQDDTDFTKALKVLKEELDTKNVKVDHVVVLCSSFDRVDHMMAHFNTLHTSMDFLRIPVYLFTGDSLSWLLAKGRHRICVPKSMVGDWCGLIPLGAPCRKVTTTGLKWNLRDSEMRFGGLVSTSNAFDGTESVTVETDEVLLWTMALSAGWRDAKTQP